MTTKVEVTFSEFTAVATAGQGPGLLTAFGTGDGAVLYWQVGPTKPGNTERGHIAEHHDQWRLESVLGTGNSLWVRTEKGKGEVHFTSDESVG